MTTPGAQIPEPDHHDFAVTARLALADRRVYKKLINVYLATEVVLA